MDRFIVLCLLGQGEFASVWKVQRKQDNKIYALKKVNINKMKQKAVQQAMDEIRFLASLKHPNIVSFYESFQIEEKHICMILEFCEYGDLEQDIAIQKKKNKPYDEATIWKYFIQILEAIYVLHRNGIVHRDVKAANCFLGNNKTIKLGDMNIAKLLPKDMFLHTQTGTQYYMSPEIWEKKPYNSSSDMWSLGVLTYELCTLHKPFFGTTTLELQTRVTTGTYPAIQPTVAQNLIYTSSILLQIIPQQRPTAKDLLDCDVVKKQRENVLLGPEDKNTVSLVQSIDVPENFIAMDFNNHLPNSLCSQQFTSSTSRKERQVLRNHAAKIHISTCTHMEARKGKNLIRPRSSVMVNSMHHPPSRFLALFDRSGIVGNIHLKAEKTNSLFFMFPHPPSASASPFHKSDLKKNETRPSLPLNRGLCKPTPEFQSFETEHELMLSDIKNLDMFREPSKIERGKRTRCSRIPSLIWGGNDPSRARVVCKENFLLKGSNLPLRPKGSGVNSVLSRKHFFSGDSR